MTSKNTNNKTSNVNTTATTQSKDNFEVEFEKKIKLSDDSEEYLYARGPKYSEDLWPIQCFLCRMGRIINQKKFQNHLENPKHVENLEKALKEPPNAEEYRQPYEQIYSDRMNLKNPIRIYPGESIDELTTDYADRLIPIKEFSWDNPPAEGYLEILKSDIILNFNKKSPLLGLCYGFKMAKDKKIAYYCSLCDVELTELNAYQHFNGKDHFNQYVKKHFPDTMVKLSKITGITEDQKATIIRSIYQKLETWKGHRPFYLVNGKAFQATKDRFVQRAHRIYHYCDTTIIFSQNELKEMFEKIKKRQILVPINPERLTKQPQNEKDLTELPADVEEKLPEVVKKENPQQKSRKRKNKNRNNDTEKNVANDAPKEKQSRIQKLKLDDSPANWEKYRLLCQRAIQSLNAEYERFAAVSERHPKYQEEWNRYWRNKTEKLRRERVNPNNYNYMPEWNDYWMLYLKHCFNKDAEKCKYEFRKNLKLPFRGRTPEPPNVFEGCKFNSNANQKSNPSTNNNNFNTNAGGSGIVKFGPQDSTGNLQSGPVPLMSVGCGGSIFSGDQIPTNNSGLKFSGGNSSGIGNSSGGGIKNQIQSPSLPIQQQQQSSSQSFMSQKQDIVQQKQQHRQLQQQQQQPEQNVANQNQSNNVPANVLSVLRLLTALESELGSLGPTANQLLGKAILYEKESKQSANELLHETEYYSLFATSLEKLKGLLLAGLIPDIKINVTKSSITDLEKILNLFDEYLRRNPDAPKSHIPSNIVLRKHEFPALESNNVQSNSMASNNNMSSSNDNFNPRTQQKNAQDLRGGEGNKWSVNQKLDSNNKWNNDEGIRGIGGGNQQSTNSGYNNYDRQSGRGNYNDNNIPSGNTSERQGNLQNNEYNNNRSIGFRNDYSQNQRSSMTGNSGSWDTGNYNQMSSGGNYNSKGSGNQERNVNLRNNDFNKRGLENKNYQRERDDLNTNDQRGNNNRFNTNQRESNNFGGNQRNDMSSFNQNNRDSSNFNNRKDDFNRGLGDSTGIGKNLNQRNSGNDFNTQRNSGNDFNNQRTSGNDYNNQRNSSNDYNNRRSSGNDYNNQRNTDNFGGNQNLRNSNQSNWNTNPSNNNFDGQNLSRKLPSLLSNNYSGNNGSNYSMGNFGGSGFGRR